MAQIGPREAAPEPPSDMGGVFSTRKGVPFGGVPVGLFAAVGSDVAGTPMKRPLRQATLADLTARHVWFKLLETFQISEAYKICSAQLPISEKKDMIHLCPMNKGLLHRGHLFTVASGSKHPRTAPAPSPAHPPVPLRP